jgi:uncharacterized RDD family membrane protein YckC
MLEVKYKLVPAGFWVRAVAFFIDSVIALPVVGAVAVIPYFVEASPGRTTYPLTGASALIAAALYGLLYPAIIEASSYRATLGKRMLGLRVVSLTGRQISFGQGLGRTFGKVISQIPFYIGFFMAGWTEKKQALHDKMAGTLVMKRVPVYIERSE